MVVLVQRRPAAVAATAKLVLDSESDSLDAFPRRRFRGPRQAAEMFVSAAAQLYAGDGTTQVRAVRTLAEIADRSTSVLRQQCVDVLCGYLPLPRCERLGGYERAVRRTITAVLGDRLRRGARRSWSGATFDLRNAHLEDADFTNAVFRGPVIFEHATLAGTTRFDGATFAAETHFQAATFDTAWFRRAVFADSARFFGARFDRARFDGTTFCGSAQFPLADFAADARFPQATFRDGAYFDSARFRGTADFGAAGFSGPARFDGATFTIDSSFDRARFPDPNPSAARDFGAAMVGDTADPPPVAAYRRPLTPIRTPATAVGPGNPG